MDAKAVKYLSLMRENLERIEVKASGLNESRHRIAVNGVALPLRWNGKSAQELAGRRVRLRIHLRSANLYALTAEKRR